MNAFVCCFCFSSETALKIVIHRSSTAQDIAHRLTWSPHVPLPAGEEEEDPDICNLVLTHGTDVSQCITPILPLPNLPPLKISMLFS